jgi:hypothetical protein
VLLFFSLLVYEENVFGFFATSVFSPFDVTCVVLVVLSIFLVVLSLTFIMVVVLQELVMV